MFVFSPATEGQANKYYHALLIIGIGALAQIALEAMWRAL